MSLKPFFDDIKQFVIYLATEPFRQVSMELKDIWNVLTSKSAWFLAWSGLFIISAFLNVRNLMIFSLVMCIFFFIIYQWQKRDWKAQAREEWYKKQGLVKFKKKDDRKD